MEKLLRIPYIGSRLLLVYMPFHVFLSQSLSLITGGLDAWKVGKDVALLALCLFIICLVWAQGKATRLFNSLVIFSAIYGVLHIVVWMAHSGLYRESAILGITYNMRLPLCLIIGSGTVLLMRKFAFSSVMRWVLLVSTLVAVLGIVQYLLPKDVLTHFGYSLARGVRPAFFIDDNTMYPRIMSTLREPNALGAYLLLPITILSFCIAEAKNQSKKLVLIGMLGLHVLALLLTFSRSAWAATALAVSLALIFYYQRQVLTLLRKYWAVVLVAVVLVCAGLVATRNTPLVHQYLIHSNQKRTNNLVDSDGLHTQLILQGLRGIVQQPLGHGPGTAGLASIHNPDGGQLTENYYVQIGYEVGVFGAILFICLNIWLYVRLRKRHDRYGMMLCASFWGYVVTNMLLHTWSNEAVAVQFWLLSGILLVVPVVKVNSPQKKQPQPSNVNTRQG